MRIFPINYEDCQYLLSIFAIINVNIHLISQYKTSGSNYDRQRLRSLALCPDKRFDESGRWTWRGSSAARIGLTETIVGLTILSVLTSFPDTLCSVIVAKHGLGDMGDRQSLHGT